MSRLLQKSKLIGSKSEQLKKPDQTKNLETIEPKSLDFDYGSTGLSLQHGYKPIHTEQVMKVLKKRQSHPTETRVEIGNCTLYLGDCLEVLKTLPDNSIDAVVTDPPAGINFMGKEWDQAKLGRDRWIDWLEERMRECFRVLKPGGHALVWALPRTSHWTATACEDAGFEIRDRVAHLFGTGFPKNMDVSKAIDKAAGADREVVGSRRLTGKARVLKGGNYVGGYEGKEIEATYNITAPATADAQKWEGWGTALKPACEDWWLCRKPLEGTVAANVLKYGTGAINFDGCRVEFQDETDKALAKPAGKLTSHGKGHLAGPKDAQEVERSGFSGEQNAKGRFPANLIHDGSDEVLEGFPNSKDGVAIQRNGGGQKIGGNGIYAGSKGLTREDVGYGGEGSAARFFKSISVDDITWLDQNLPINLASIAVDYSALPNDLAASVVTRVVNEALPDQIILENCKGLTTPVTVTELRRLCEIAIKVIQHIGRSVWLGQPLTKDTKNDNHVRTAEIQSQTGITTIMINRWKSDGSVDPVTLSITKSSTGVGVQDSLSRIKYCTKASKKDRNEGGVTNKHPTVKNTELMQYLCRLITPPGGIVLDPFAGSFSTGKAAIKEGFGFIGIEAQQEYFDVGVQRIRHEVSKTLSFRH